MNTIWDEWLDGGDDADVGAFILVAVVDVISVAIMGDEVGLQPVVY